MDIARIIRIDFEISALKCIKDKMTNLGFLTLSKG